MPPLDALLGAMKDPGSGHGDVRRRGWLLAGLGSVLLIHTTIRAATVSFTWDEGFTFMQHVSRGKFFQDTFDMMGANHHLLNVWGMMACLKLFGSSELSLRVPNLLAHVLYLYASARIASRAPSAWQVVAAFILFNAHPYLLDFFSLARGYGLANGFILMSLWCAWRYWHEGRTNRWLGWSLAWAALATLANAMALDHLLGLSMAFVACWAWDARRTGLSGKVPQFATMIIIVGMTLGIVLPTLLKLSAGGSLHMGCAALWDGTVSTFMERYLYHQDYGQGHLVLAGGILVAVAAWCGLAALVIFRGPLRERARTWVFGLLTLASITAILAMQHLLFHTPWPRSRTALFLLPTLLFIVVLPLVEAPPRRWTMVAAITFCLPLLVHTGRCWNTTYCIEWKGSGELRHMLDLIERDRPAATLERPLVTLEAGDENHGPLPYYCATEGLRWLAHTVRYAPDPFRASAYYIVEYDGQDRVDHVNWTLLYHSRACNTSLYRDERFRGEELQVVYHGTEGMEAVDMPGAVHDDRTEGVPNRRSDGSAAGPVSVQWTVPDDWDGSDVLASGALMLNQGGDETWMTLWITVERAGVTVEKRDLAATSQIDEFGRWCRVGVELRTSGGLQPGDVLTFGAAPYTLDTSFLVDDMELWVMRE